MNLKFLQNISIHFTLKCPAIRKLSIILIIMSSLNSDYLFANSYIILPFSYINPKTGNEKVLTDNITNFFYSTFYNTVYSTIKINNKDVKFHLSTERHAAYLSEKNLQQKLNDDSKKYSLEYIGINRATISHQNTSLVSNVSNNNNFNFSLFAIDKIIDHSEYERYHYGYAEYTEEIGFNIIKGNRKSKVDVEEDDEEEYYTNDDDQLEDKYYNDDDSKLKNNEKKTSEEYVLKNNGYEVEQYTNFVYQLKSKNLTNSYAFMIKYSNNEEKGEIIIGGLPHEYDPRHYSEKHFVYDTVSIGMYPPFSWHTVFDMIKYGNVEINSMKAVRFSLDYGFIVGSISYRDSLYNKFFGYSEYKNYCNEDIINGYSVFSCQESVIKNFKNMTFYISTKYYDNNKYNKLEFTYEDLFVKSSSENKYYFLMIFQSTDDWVFGKPCFKKYPFIFDQDRKIYGFYNETGEYEVPEEKKLNSGSFNYYLVIIIILIIVVVVLAVLLYKYGWNILPRKKKANELIDDNYEYNPALDPESEAANKN